MDVVLNHDKNYCHIAESLELSSPALEAQQAKKLEAKHEIVSDQNSDFLGLEIDVIDKLTEEEFDTLPSEIKDFCHGLPSYKVIYIKTKMSKEEFLHSHDMVEHSSNNTHNTNQLDFKEEHLITRQKREVINWSECPILETKVSMFSSL